MAAHTAQIMTILGCLLYGSGGDDDGKILVLRVKLVARQLLLRHPGHESDSSQYVTVRLH